MRCPKCGFHSFDHLDSCKKCGGDLTQLKSRFKHQGYVIPAATATAAAAGVAPAVAGATEPDKEAVPMPAVAEAEDEAIDFGFDILGEETAAPQAENAVADNGLNFEQPFDLESDRPFDFEEKLPGDDLPKLDDLL